MPNVNIAPWSALTQAAQQQEDGEEEGVGGGHDDGAAPENMQSPPSRHYPRLVQKASECWWQWLACAVQTIQQQRT